MRTFIFLSLAGGLISCASLKNIKVQEIEVSDINQHIEDPIHYINQTFQQKIDEDKLQVLVNWVSGKKLEIRNYLKEQMFLKGQFEYLAGHYPEAKVFFEQAINLDEQDDYLKIKYALTQVRLGKLKKARTALVNIREENHDEKTRLLLAGIEVSLNNIKSSRSLYQKILSKNKKAKEACLFLGKSYSRENKFTQARKQFFQCLKSMPGIAKFHFEIAKTYLQQNKSKYAVTQLKKALKVQPHYSQAVLTLGRIYEGDKQDKKAFDLYKKFLAGDPSNFYVINKMANWHLERQESTKAIPYIESLIDLDSSNTALRVKLGILYVEGQKYAQAVSLFNEYLEQFPKEEKVHYYLAAVYQEVRDFEKAIHHYSQIKQKSQLFEDSVLQIATILSVLAGNDPSYEDQLTIHIQDNLSIGAIALELQVIQASYYEKRQKYADAISIMEKAKKSTGYQESHILYLVSLYEKNEQFSLVDKELSELIKKDPNNARALNFLGYFYLERGEKLDEAKSLISKALSLRPTDGYIRDSMGWYYYLKGDFKTALQFLKKAYKDSGRDTEVALHLAQAYQAAGDLNQALSLYQGLRNKSLDNAQRKRLADSINKVINLKNAKRLPASIKKIPRK